MNDDLITQQSMLIDSILFKVINHSFSVSFNSGPSSRRECQLSGPILLIVDAKKMKLPYNIYLPEWEYSVKKAKTHKTIVIKSKNTENLQIIKLKSKKHSIIDGWAKAISLFLGEVANLKIRTVKYRCSINLDGAFLKGHIYVSNDSITITRHGKEISNFPRYPGINASPDLNNPKKIFIFKNGIKANTLICDSIEMTRKVLIALNSIPDDLQTVPDFFFNEITVPDIPEELIDELETSDGIIVKSKKKTKKRGEKKKKSKRNVKRVVIDAGFIPVDKNPWPECEPSYASCSDFESQGSESENHGINDIISFQVRMEERLKKLQKLPRNEKPPEIKDLIKDQCSYFQLIQKPGSCPDVSYPDSLDEMIFFNMPINAFTNALFSDKLQIPKALNISTIQDSFKIDQIFNEFPNNIKSMIQEMNIEPPKTPINLYNEIMKEVRLLPNEELPIVVAGLFIHSRYRSISDIAGQLEKIDFSFKSIHNEIHKASIKDEDSLKIFFINLYDKGYTRFFFETLSNEQDFRRNNYLPDAFMRCDKFCNDISSISSKIDKDDIKMIPFPYQNVVSPYVILSNSVLNVISSLSNGLVNQTSNNNHPTDLSLIVYSVLILLEHGNKNDIKSQLTTDYGYLWNQIYYKKKYFYKQELFDFYIYDPKEIKVIGFIIRLIFDCTLSKFLMIYLSLENPCYEIQIEFILSIYKLMSLEQIHKTTIKNLSLATETKTLVDGIISKTIS